jgi:hypothetical protein
VGSILLGTYGAIADYKSFKESVVEMCADAREFAADLCGPFTTKAGVPKDEIYRFEKRLKTPGKLYNLSRDLERLERSTTELSPRDVQRELSRMRAKLDRIAADLSAHEMEAVTSSLKTRRLPPPQKWPDNEGPPKHAIHKTEDQPSLFGGELEQEDQSPKGRMVFKARTLVTEGARRRRGAVAKQETLPALKD